MIGQCSGPGEPGSEYIAHSQSDSLSKFRLCSGENSAFGKSRGLWEAEEEDDEDEDEEDDRSGGGVYGLSVCTFTECLRERKAPLAIRTFRPGV